MGAIRKIRFPRDLYDATWKMTEIASMTNTPPTNSSSNSCLLTTATVPSAAPSGREPTSPMNTEAG